MHHRNAPDARSWTKPVLVRLGQLKDVAPRVPGLAEGNSGKS